MRYAIHEVVAPQAGAEMYAEETLNPHPLWLLSRGRKIIDKGIMWRYRRGNQVMVRRLSGRACE